MKDIKLQYTEDTINKRRFPLLPSDPKWEQVMKMCKNDNSSYFNDTLLHSILDSCDLNRMNADANKFLDFANSPQGLDIQVILDGKTKILMQGFRHMNMICQALNLSEEFKKLPQIAVNGEQSSSTLLKFIEQLVLHINRTY